MTGRKTYSYSASIKSGVSDELINTYLIRPLAGIVVRCLFFTPFTPNYVTLASTLIGFLSAFLYSEGSATHNLVAGLCLTFKDILDSADGQLARAKQQFSRRGRFLDSIGDFSVNLLVFAAIAGSLFSISHAPVVLLLGLFGFAGITLRVSYHVFYQTSYLHLRDAYTVNRLTEELREEDMKQDHVTLQLQNMFQFLYGWQDRLMARIDEWCRNGLTRNEHNDEAWYSDRVGLGLSGLLGLGTELFVLMVFSVTNLLENYLYFNLIAMNGIWLASLVYRRMFLTQMLTSAPPSTRS